MPIGEQVAQNGLMDEGLYKAARDILLKRAPRIKVAFPSEFLIFLYNSGETASFISINL